MSFLSLLVGRIWVFVSPRAAVIEYQNLEPEFYENSTDASKVGVFRAWYHGARFAETQRNVLRLSQPGAVIYDLGCGGSEWNRTRLPVLGVDVNESMLRYGLQRGYLADYRVAPVERTGLPSKSADLVVLTEVLEHAEEPESALREAERLLRKGGLLIVSVPWDHPFSPFFWLFNANCLYRGYFLGEEYYRQRCGHVHHFTKTRLRKLLRRRELEIDRLYLFRGLLVYAVCSRRKTPHGN
jgi:2-polyprenyl-3-methyl-5-hydroxy-6-metoxy-1,4-benzoquinol methylase